MINWFARNPIAANLLMVLVLYGGFSTYPQLDREFFPQRGLDLITVSMSYPGAGPEEIELQIINRIEEAVSEVDGIDEIRSTAREGLARLSIDIAKGYESISVLNDVNTAVDGITQFPALAEPPEVSEVKWKNSVISIALYGDLPEAELKELGNRLREELAERPDIPDVDLREPRKYELAIEVSEENLQRYKLTFDDVVRAVQNSSLNVPGGKLRTYNGDIQIQTRAQAYVAADFENLTLIRNSDGAIIKVGDVARVIDGFEERDIIGRFSGKPSLSLDVSISANPDIVGVSDSVRAFIEDVRPTLPEGVELYLWRDMADPFKARISTLFQNGIGGLALVFTLLLLFLRPMLAMWVCVGISVAFFGAIALMPIPGITLNMVSLFAFIMILGILVDDAIIVGEAIHTEQAKGGDGLEAAVRGVQLVKKPVLFAVISTMIFFIPFFSLGDDQPEAVNMAWVVLIALTFSLIESLLILPAHLASMKPEKNYRIFAPLTWLRGHCANGMDHLAERIYHPFLKLCIDWSGTTLITFVLFFFVIASVVTGGWMRTSFFPVVTVDNLRAEVTLYEGAAFSVNEAVLKQLEDAARQLRDELNGDPDMPGGGHIDSSTYSSTVRVSIELLDLEESGVSPAVLKDRWQQLIGELANVKDFNITFTVFNLGKPIQLEIATEDLENLKQISNELTEELKRFPGVFNIRSTLEDPVAELRLVLKPHAETLGVSLNDVANQVRQGFYGVEVQRIPRKREDVKVMVRYNSDARQSVEDLRNMRIRTATGEEIPFDAVARWEFTDSYSKIDHLDRKRVARVTAELQSGFSPRPVIAQVMRDLVPKWQQQFGIVEVRTSGEAQEEADFISRAMQLFAGSLLIIYGLFAIVFRSWSQPVLVISAIPFGFAGSMIGHLLFDQEITMFSILGVIAVAGVVVNDNLVMIDRINRLADEGMDLITAINRGAADRFRAIILTSITTFVGLLPVMMQNSTQAQFLRPMVLSLAFGIIIATFVTLLMVPCLYVWGDRVIKRLSGRVVAPA